MRKIWILSSLIMLLMTFYQINNTYAKYSSEAQGLLEETIGKWIVKVNATNIATETDVQDFVINDLTYATNDNIISGKIAPGQEGYFDIVIDASESSVALIYDVAIDISGLDINEAMKITKIVRVIDGTESEEGIVRTAENTYSGILGIEHIKEPKTHTMRFYLGWENDETGKNDLTDTTIGKTKDMKISIPVQVKVSQYLGEDMVEYTEQDI